MEIGKPSKAIDNKETDHIVEIAEAEVGTNKTYQYVIGGYQSIYKVFVSNLAYETNWKNLKDHFRKVGDVSRADVFMDDKGRSRGIG